MKMSQIEVGATYYNRGAGRTKRKIIAIGNEHRPKTFYSPNMPPSEVGIRYEQDGVERCLYISSFLKWCGGRVTE